SCGRCRSTCCAPPVRWPRPSTPVRPPPPSALTWSTSPPGWRARPAACNCTCPATGPGPTPGGSCSPPSTPHPTAADLPLSTARQGPTGTEHVAELGRPADHPCPRAGDDSSVLPKRPGRPPGYTVRRRQRTPG